MHILPASLALLLLAFLDRVLAVPRWRPDLRRSHSSSLRSRDDFLQSLGLDINPQNSTIVSLALASDKQTYYALSHVGDVSLRLAIDTGSADLWLLSSACTSSACSGLPKYPLAFESSTFQGIDNNQTSFAVSYADGTGAQGFVAREAISIGNMTVQNQAFGLVSSSNVTFTDDVSGILGLGFPRLSTISNTVVNATPFFSSLAQNGMLDYPLFGLSLTRDASGSLTFGGLDGSVVENKTLIEWNEVVPFAPFAGTAGNTSSYLHWTLVLEGLSVNGSEITPEPTFPAETMNSTIALIDAGTAGIFGPYRDVAAIFSKIDSARLVDEASGQWVVPCDIDVTLSFNFGGMDFVMQPTDYLIGPASGNPNLCLSWPQGRALTSDGIDWQIGTPFLRTVYSVFSHGIDTKESPMIGFYPMSNATTLNETTAEIASFLAANSATQATTLPNFLLSTPTSFTTPIYTFNTSIAATVTPGQLMPSALATSTYSALLQSKHRNLTALATLLPSPTLQTFVITDTSGHTVTSVSTAASVTLGVPPGWTPSAARGPPAPSKAVGAGVAALAVLLLGGAFAAW